ncbi:MULTISPECIES: DUF2780 domain-containing protein [Hyphomicrobiales]|uniref:DUF2780 domain-containing protein n=1 Tax=Prosthecodimorpha staleyi TaxID=2840188 RepID=A0A947GA39_9HYPH|nr:MULTISPECIES: DUF2780 domain-containing protein [Hyphomicrobiales]MBT9288678.1 DUF2780 domain-containing protein [Prosthecodimorpha staleyi]MCW1843551.1 DUF2267 domain-containing protein [Prosthecomicrobium hirschii]
MSHTAKAKSRESRLVEELVGRIQNKVGIDEETASRAVAIILHFLKSEAPPELIDRIVASIPGAGELMAEGEAPPKPGGLMGSITGMLGGLLGGGMGGIMAAFTMLSEAGLDMDQVQKVTREVIQFSREQAGDTLVDEVLGSIPGLARFAG